MGFLLWELNIDPKAQAGLSSLSELWGSTVGAGTGWGQGGSAGAACSSLQCGQEAAAMLELSKGVVGGN